MNSCFLPAAVTGARPFHAVDGDCASFKVSGAVPGPVSTAREVSASSERSWPLYPYLYLPRVHGVLSIQAFVTVRLTSLSSLIYEVR